MKGAVNTTSQNDGLMDFLRSANSVFAFPLELALLAAYVYGGFSLPLATPLRALVGVGSLAVVVIVWGTMLAPRARHRLSPLWLVLVKLVLFGGATALLVAVHQTVLAIALAALTVLNLGLAAMWRTL